MCLPPRGSLPASSAPGWEESLLPRGQSLAQTEDRLLLIHPAVSQTYRKERNPIRPTVTFLLSCSPFCPGREWGGTDIPGTMAPPWPSPDGMEDLGSLAWPQIHSTPYSCMLLPFPAVTRTNNNLRRPGKQSLGLTKDILLVLAPHPPLRFLATKLHGGALRLEGEASRDTEVKDPMPIPLATITWSSLFSESEHLG